MSCRRLVFLSVSLSLAAGAVAAASIGPLPVPAPKPLKHGGAAVDEEDADGSPWRGRMTASLSLTAGNSRTSAAQADLDIDRSRKGGKTSVLATVSEAQSGKGNERETTTARWAGSVQHDRDVDEVRYAFARLSLEHDRVIELQARTQTAIGVGHHLLVEEGRTLNVYAGLGRSVSFYREEKTIAGDTDSRFAYNFVLLGNEYTEQLTPTVLFKQRLEGLVSFSGQRSEVLRFRSSLHVDMTRTLALTVALNNTYNSRVAADERRNDLSFTTGLSVKIGP